MTRNTLVMAIIFTILVYLSYVLYVLIKVRYFRDPNYIIFKHQMNPNITIQNCKDECPQFDNWDQPEKIVSPEKICQ